MLNPLGRAYQGYAAANQSVLEEDEENTDGASPRHDDIDLEAQATPTSNSKASFATSTPLLRLSRGGIEPGVPRPNVREDDRIQEESESDGEVPQSFLIKSPAACCNPLSRKGRSRDTHPALNATTPRDSPQISVPPCPSEINPDRPPSWSPSVAAQPNPKHGLDAYERTLWNWVNVYTLDAFLQEVYVYYHGKGIYSIAFKRGLNLLWVLPLYVRGLLIPSPAQSGSSSAFQHSSSAASIIRVYTLIKSRLSDIVVERCISR